jgi:Ca2+-binding EF-hand superfamily protein
LFDLDRDSHLDFHEFKVSMRALGFTLPKAEIVSLLHTHGVPRNSTLPPPSSSKPPPPPSTSTAQTPTTRLLISLPQFQALMAQKILARDPREEVLRAFALFDQGDKGIITVDDLRRVARELGEALEEEEIVAMVEEFDLDGDGGINREEFLGICLQ